MYIKETSCDNDKSEKPERFVYYQNDNIAYLVWWKWCVSLKTNMSRWVHAL